MKLSALLLAAALVGSASLLLAGPDSRTFMLPKEPAKASATANVTATPATTPAMTVATCTTCACCKKTS